jgi:hypothetical protein
VGIPQGRLPTSFHRQTTSTKETRLVVLNTITSCLERVNTAGIYRERWSRGYSIAMSSIRVTLLDGHWIKPTLKLPLIQRRVSNQHVLNVGKWVEGPARVSWMVSSLVIDTGSPLVARCHAGSSDMWTHESMCS